MNAKRTLADSIDENAKKMSILVENSTSGSDCSFINDKGQLCRKFANGAIEVMNENPIPFNLKSE